MEFKLISPLTSINLPHFFPIYPLKFPIRQSYLPSFIHPSHNFSLTQQNSTAPPSKIITAASTTASNSITPSFTASYSSKNFHWMVIIDKPPPDVVDSKPALVNYYVNILQKVLGSDEKSAQRCIYDACCDKTNFGFCCFVDEQASHVLAGMPGVLGVKPDPDINSANKDYRHNFNLESSASLPAPLFFPRGWKHWLVCVEKPSAIIFSKTQMVDFYVGILTKVLGNKKDAQMCLYHSSWQSNYGFCCVLDDECAQELVAVPGVLSIQPDENFESENKNYGGSKLSSDAVSSSETDTSKTKLFITGLSFYTSEKTLRAAFEPFGEIVEVKVIMDKISKRSKGYAFIEYTTEDAATTALQEMNGKIINGWMIVVDRAKNRPRISKP